MNNEAYFDCPKCGYENCIEMGHNEKTNKRCQNNDCRAYLEISTFPDVRIVTDYLVASLRTEATEMEKALLRMGGEK